MAKQPPVTGFMCYTEDTLLGIMDGADGFLEDKDVFSAKTRLSLIDEYDDHLDQQAGDHSQGKYILRNCTGRQKRLVAYYKVYRHIFGKGERGVRKILPACCCLCVRQADVPR